ncbi:outer membrane lipoprotein-sorting protein [Candidatus Pelagibacter sp.]|uniref:outer membrane lipoprotein-sorting protein n=1 Tax=Candidatus Pelagibacter sp. TaxID=2024849 RepID=UPI003F831E4F
MKYLISIIITLTIWSTSLSAQTNEEKGLEIIKKSIALDNGFIDSTVEGQMVLKDKSGNESVRKFKNLIFEELDDALGDKSIIVFTEPRDVKGTSLLTHAKIEPQDDDQWLYLPALKRVKRISSSNRTGKFVSSEFSYEDLSTDEPEDYTFKWIEDGPCLTETSLTCHLIEATPKNKKSGYSKRVIYVDTDEFLYQSVKFYNRRGDLEKELHFKGYQKYLDKFWRADLLEMTNLQTGKSTVIAWENYQFQTNLSLNDFKPEKLAKMAR